MSSIRDYFRANPQTDPVQSSEPEEISQGNQVEPEKEAQIEAPPAETEEVKPPVYSSYTDIIKTINPDPAPSEEDIKKEKRRETARSTISAVGDGISALANLWGTSQGTVNAAQPNLSGANAERYKRLLDKRDRNKEIYRSLMTSGAFKDKAQAYQEYRDKKADKRYDDSLKLQQRNLDTQNKRYEQQDKRYDKQDERQTEEMKLRREQLEEQKRNGAAERAYKAQMGQSMQDYRKAATDNMQSKSEAVKAKAVKDGKGELFVTEEGTSYYIPKQKWDSNAAKVYEIIRKDEKLMKEIEGLTGIGFMTAKEKDKALWVKQLWQSSPEAVKYIESIAEEPGEEAPKKKIAGFSEEQKSNKKPIKGF
ncbi:MAG: hypothetical protein RR382_01895 [Tannerellaceae bacterium]